MNNLLKNKITGEYYNGRNFEGGIETAVQIDTNDETFMTAFRYTWGNNFEIVKPDPMKRKPTKALSDVLEVLDVIEARKKLLAKADKMRKNAYLNRATNSRNAKVARMMIGRADALEAKAYNL